MIHTMDFRGKLLGDICAFHIVAIQFYSQIKSFRGINIICNNRFMHIRTHPGNIAQGAFTHSCKINLYIIYNVQNTEIPGGKLKIPDSNLITLLFKAVNNFPRQRMD